VFSGENISKGFSFVYTYAELYKEKKKTQPEREGSCLSVTPPPCRRGLLRETVDVKSLVDGQI
jgi:hypothetical protein